MLNEKDRRVLKRGGHFKKVWVLLNRTSDQRNQCQGKDLLPLYIGVWGDQAWHRNLLGLSPCGDGEVWSEGIPRGTRELQCLYSYCERRKRKTVTEKWRSYQFVLQGPPPPLGEIIKSI